MWIYCVDQVIHRGLPQAFSCWLWVQPFSHCQVCVKLQSGPQISEEWCTSLCTWLDNGAIKYLTVRNHAIIWFPRGLQQCVQCTESWTRGFPYATSCHLFVEMQLSIFMLTAVLSVHMATNFVIQAIHCGLCSSLRSQFKQSEKFSMFSSHFFKYCSYITSFGIWYKHTRYCLVCVSDEKSLFGLGFGEHCWLDALICSFWAHMGLKIHALNDIYIGVCWKLCAFHRDAKGCPLHQKTWQSISVWHAEKSQTQAGKTKVNSLFFDTDKM